VEEGPELFVLLLNSPLPGVEQPPRELLRAVSNEHLGREVQVDDAGPRLVFLSELDIAPEAKQPG
jgi:hypothetical protein